MHYTLKGPLKLDGGEETKIFDLVMKNNGAQTVCSSARLTYFSVVRGCSICGIPCRQRTEDRLHIRRARLSLSIREGLDCVVAFLGNLRRNRVDGNAPSTYLLA